MAYRVLEPVALVWTSSYLPPHLEPPGLDLDLIGGQVNQLLLQGAVLRLLLQPVAKRERGRQAHEANGCFCNAIGSTLSVNTAYWLCERNTAM